MYRRLQPYALGARAACRGGGRRRAGAGTAGGGIGGALAAQQARAKWPCSQQPTPTRQPTAPEAPPACAGPPSCAARGAPLPRGLPTGRRGRGGALGGCPKPQTLVPRGHPSVTVPVLPSPCDRPRATVPV